MARRVQLYGKERRPSVAQGQLLFAHAVANGSRFAFARVHLSNVVAGGWVALLAATLEQ